MPAESAEQFAAARSGSEAALGQALEACRVYLLMIAEREMEPHLRAKGGASDLVQQTFMEAQAAFPQFHGNNSGEWRAWLRRLLLNNLANFRRTYVQTAKRAVKREVALAGNDSDAGSSWLEGDEPTPSKILMKQESQAALLKVLQRLPEDYREVLLLRYQEELPFEEIAQKMGRTGNAVRKLWARAVQRLQEEMESEQ